MALTSDPSTSVLIGDPKHIPPGPPIHVKEIKVNRYETTARPAIAGLVLAAGESSRMGRDKALLSYRGQTFLETIVAKLREAGISRTAVVLGHHADEIR
jgi:MobA-like NTP transferase domain